MGTLFKLVCLETKEDYMSKGVMLTFTDGKEATAMSQALTASQGRKWQPRKLVTDDKWKERETKRFQDGAYKHVPWETQKWWKGTKPCLEHFAHVSIERDAKIAFTMDAHQGSSDIQTRIKPGRYLERYFGDVLSGDEIRRWVAEFSVTYEPNKLNLATKPKEILDVYVNGPTSCMTHPMPQFISRLVKKHPVEAYAGGDLAVAFLEGDGRAPCEDCNELCDGCDGEALTYNARAVVWPEKKIYGRIYGDADRMHLVLKKAGYSASNAFAGAKLARIPVSMKLLAGHVSKCNGAFVCPYLDSNTLVRDDGTHLIIDDVKGTMNARQTHGLCIDNRIKCEGCGQLDMPEEFVRVMDKTGDRSNSACSACVRDNTKFVIDANSGHYCLRKDVIWVEGFDPVFFANIDKHFGVCDKTKILCLKSQMKQMVGGLWVSREWFNANGKVCQVCNLGLSRTGTEGCGKYNCWDDNWKTKNAELYAKALEYTMAHQKRDGYNQAEPISGYLEHYIAKLQKLEAK